MRIIFIKGPIVENNNQGSGGKRYSGFGKLPGFPYSGNHLIAIAVKIIDMGEGVLKFSYRAGKRTAQATYTPVKYLFIRSVKTANHALMRSINYAFIGVQPIVKSAGVQTKKIVELPGVRTRLVVRLIRKRARSLVRAYNRSYPHVAFVCKKASTSVALIYRQTKKNWHMALL